MERALFAVYTVICPRRLLDYSEMRVHFTNDQALESLDKKDTQEVKSFAKPLACSY